MSFHMSFWCQALVWLALAGPISSRWITVLSRKDLKTTTVWTRPTTLPTTRLPRNTDTRFIKEIYQYGFMGPSPELCPNQGAGLHLLILVTSAIPDRALRDGIRESWATYSNLRNFAVGFMLGRVDLLEKFELERIKAEKSLHEDLIFGNFQDTYTNLTLKSLAVLEWAATYCSKVLKVMKVDDDVYINIPKLMSFIQDPERMNETNMIYGSWSYNRPVRRLSHKHFVSFEQYPFFAFPPYLAGSAYIMTSDAVKKLLLALPNYRYMAVEDVLITGIVADGQHINKEYIRNFLHQNTPYNIKSVCMSMKFVGTHMMGQNVAVLHRDLQSALSNAQCFTNYYELYPY